MQFLFALIQIGLILALVCLHRVRPQGKTLRCLVFTILIAIPSFIPTTPTFNIRIDLFLTDSVLTPIIAIYTALIWIGQRRHNL